MTTVVHSGASFVPAGTDCGALVRQILDFFQAPDDPTLISLALQGINSGISMINSRTWRQITNSDDITLDNTNDRYSLPDDFKQPIRLLELNASAKRTGSICYLAPGEFYLAFRDNTQASNPLHYTVDHSARVFVLSCVPSSGYTAQVPTLRSQYHKRVLKLNCTGTTGIPPEFDEFLVARGSLWCAMARDPQLRRMFAEESTERWRYLMADDADVITGYEP